MASSKKKNSLFHISMDADAAGVQPPASTSHCLCPIDTSVSPAQPTASSSSSELQKYTSSPSTVKSDFNFILFLYLKI